MVHALVLFACFSMSLALPPGAKTIEIAPGVLMPVVSLGTARGCPPSRKDIDYDIPTALSVGLVAIDTAHNSPCYDDTEVGKVLKNISAARDSYFITSKIDGFYPNQTVSAAKQLEDSLANLGLDFVDLMLLHHPTSYQLIGEAFPGTVPSFEQGLQKDWAAMESFYKAGKARAIGVSNYDNFCMETTLKAASVKPAVNQVAYHAGMGNDADGIVSYAKDHNITIMAFSAVDWGNPALTRGEPYKSIGAAHGKSTVQVALRWLVQRGMALVTASENKTHLKQDVDIFDFELSEADMTNISAQVSCQAGARAPPYCLPYYRGDCSNVYGRGERCYSPPAPPVHWPVRIKLYERDSDCQRPFNSYPEEAFAKAPSKATGTCYKFNDSYYLPPPDWNVSERAIFLIYVNTSAVGTQLCDVTCKSCTPVTNITVGPCIVSSHPSLPSMMITRNPFDPLIVIV